MNPLESHLIAYLYRLRYIERWSLMRNTIKENVAEHSFHVALLTHCLCTIANDIYNKNINTDKAVTLAIFHDVTEVFTGDIPTPVKHHNKEILKNFRDLEHLAAERLANKAPEQLTHTYNELIIGETNETIAKYVKAADLLDAYLKCVTEVSADNKEFVVAKKQIEQSIAKLNMPEIDYFLRTFAPSFEKTLDELSE